MTLSTLSAPLQERAGRPSRSDRAEALASELARSRQLYQLALYRIQVVEQERDLWKAAALHAQATPTASPAAGDPHQRWQARCGTCPRDYQLRKDGLVPIHKYRRRSCDGSRRPPAPGTVRPLPDRTTPLIPAA
jgi:hypothetical protein